MKKKELQQWEVVETGSSSKESRMLVPRGWFYRSDGELKPCPRVQLKFMVDPDYLKCNTFINDPVRCIVTDPEAVFLMGILGESEREMVKAGFPFYFERQLAKKLIKAGFAEERKSSLPAPPAAPAEGLVEALEKISELCVWDGRGTKNIHEINEISKKTLAVYRAASEKEEGKEPK